MARGRERSMEQRMWLWRRRSPEQAAVGDDPHSLLHKENVAVAEELRRSLRTLDEKLASAIDESNAKDELLAKHTRVAEEALEGWEKAEAEAAFFKQELDDAEKKISVEREKAESEAAFLKQALDDAEKKISLEKQKAQDLALELEKMVSVNYNLVETLAEKEKARKTMEENLFSVENQNASLKYEFCMMEEELQIKSEEKERNHLVMAKRISELETECQRLRAMLRRRVHSPAAVVKTRSEVRFSAAPPQAAKVGALEEENRVLSDTLGKKTQELQSAWIMCARTASKLSRAETELEELRRRNGGTAGVDGSELSGAGAQWASALISELENFRRGKSATPTGASAGAAAELCLMDDFLEMEQSAAVSSNAASEGEPVSLCTLSSLDSSLSSSAKAEAEDPADQCRHNLAAAAVKRLAELADGIKEKSSSVGGDGDVSLLFQWKPSELFPVLQGFAQACNGFLEQTNDLDAFFQALTSAMEWLAGHCLPLPEDDRRGRSPASERKEPEHGGNEDQKSPPKTVGWEISMASEKLAECQETIVNLGKQLKALAAPKDAALFDQVISPGAGAGAGGRRLALLDWILADSERSSDGRFAGDETPVPDVASNPNAGLLYGKGLVFAGGGVQTSPARKAKEGSETGAIVVAQKRSRRGVSLLLRRLLLRRKDNATRKLALHAVPRTK